MQRKKIIVSVFNNLYTDQRVEKTCRTLYENGYEIVLIGNNREGNPEMQRPYFWTRIPIKIKKLRYAYLEYNYRLYFEIQKYAGNDSILWANDLDTLLPNYLISKKLNIPLVYDSHEIFTQMPSVKGRWVQKMWLFLEKKILPNLPHMITASDSYAEWYYKKYYIPTTVVRNLPNRIENTPKITVNSPKIILYQGAINPSRGIPNAILAMKFVNNAILKIAGEGPKIAEYKELVVKENLEEKVFFLGKLAPMELRKITDKADLGLSIEENNGESYFYSFPNKVSDYLQARVPVVLSDFPEMKKVLNAYKVGEHIHHHEPQHLATTFEKVLQKGREHYIIQLEKAAEVYCWEKEESKILEVIKKVGW